jgi:hypothetical protein
MMRAFTEHGVCPPDGRQGDREARRHGPGPAGVAFLSLGLGLAVWAHVTADDEPGGSLISASLLTLAALAATGAGLTLLVQGAHAPVRKVFRFGTLRLAAGALFIIGMLHVATLLWFDVFGQVWTLSSVDACMIAGVGSLGAAVGALLFAVVAIRLCWVAFLEEYWAHP